MSLLMSASQLVELAGDRVAFQVPRSFMVVFPEDGRMWLRIGPRSAEVAELLGRVGRVISGDGHLLYSVELEQVDGRETLQRAITALRGALGR